MLRARHTAALLAALVLTGCGSRRPHEPPGVVTLEFYNYASPEFLALYNEKLIPAFEKKHPNIRIRTSTSLGDSGYDAKLLTLIAGRIAPDIIHVTQQNFPFYAQRGLLLPLDDFIARDPAFHEEDYYAPVLDGLRSNGSLLGLPSDFSTIVMLYNRDLFDAAGIPCPAPDWTWEDFRRTCRALTKDRDGDGITDVYGFYVNGFYNRWPAWVWMNGGEILDRRGRCVMDDPRSIEGLAFYANLSLKDHVAPTAAQQMGQDFEDLFASQSVAIIADSRYAYKRFLRRRGLKFRWDVAPMPRGRVRATTLIWGGNCILRSTRHPKEAWQFLKFLSGPEAAALNLEAGNALPPLKKAAEETVRHPHIPGTPEHDRYFLDAISYGRTAPFPPQVAEFSAANNNLGDAFLGIKPVDQACRDFAREVNAAIEGRVF